MRKRSIVLLGLGLTVVLLVALVAVAMSPPVVRRVAVSAIGAMTGRQVTIDEARFDPFRGTLAVTGFRLADGDGAPFATFERLDVRLALASLLRGHLHVRDLVLKNSTVNVVRYESGEFNLADMIRRTDKKSEGGMLDVTVDHFLLDGGLVALDDRMLHPPRTWRSENIRLEAHNVSTLRDDGRATGSSLLNGSPVSIQVDDLRLVPAHLRAVVELKDGDLAMARVYLPQDTQVTIDRGRLSTRMAVVYDARDGAKVEGDGRIAEAVVLRRHQKDPVVTAAEIKFAFRDLSVGNDGTFALARFEATGGGSGQATASAATRFAIQRLRAVIEDVTWPVKGPARIDIASTVPGGGEVSIRGTARMNPQRADLDVRASGVDLAPWARFIPSAARVTGVADARFKVNARLGDDLSATASGTAGVSKLVVADGDRRLLAADRAEVSSLDFGWPRTVSVGRVRVVRPSAVVERDANGEFPLVKLLTARPADAPAPTTAPAAATKSAPSVGALPGPLKVGEIVVEDGQIAWRDASVKPAARVDVDAIRVTVRDAEWPLAGPLRVSLQARTPKNGRVNGQGTVTMEPPGADLRLVAEGVDITAAAPYAALPVQVGGRADADLRVVASRATPTEWRATARGRAALNGATVTDGGTQVAVVERLAITGLDAEWPTRVVAQRIDVVRPVVLVERNDKGEFPLKTIASRRAPAATNGTTAAASPDTSGQEQKLAFSVRQAVIDDGTVRFVDRSLANAFTEEMRKLNVRVIGAGTEPGPPAKYQLSAVLDGRSRLALRGQFGPIGEVLAISGDGELREFLVPRVNPYLKHFVSWEARDGRLNTTLRYRIDGDELDARSEIRIGRLDLIRVAPDDPAQKKVGLPLGMVAGLLKDSRGDIVVAIPVGGRLSDPQFDFSEAIWGAIRTITVKTIAAPVAWIGRLKVGRDSRIQDIEIDPVAFEAGTTKLTAKGADQIERLSGYLRHSAGAKMVLTPVVTVGDIDRLRAEAALATVQQRSRDRSVSELIAAQQLYTERFPKREPPTTHEELIAALRDAQPPPEKEAQRLAEKRVDAVRDALKRAGIDPARLEPSRDVEGLEAPEGGRVEIARTDRVRPKRGLLAELIQKLAEIFARAKA